jgi:hypothetical protein
MDPVKLGTLRGRTLQLFLRLHKKEFIPLDVSVVGWGICNLEGIGDWRAFAGLGRACVPEWLLQLLGRGTAQL